MRRVVFVLLCLVLAVSMVAIPADTISAKPSDLPQLSPASPAQQQEQEELIIEDILDELKYARSKLTQDKDIRNHIAVISDWVKKLRELIRSGDTETAWEVKLAIAERLEWLINELPKESPSTSTLLLTAAAPTQPTTNPLYEELVNIRGKIEALIELERTPARVRPIQPEIHRIPEAESLIIYSAKFLCGPAFGKEGVEPGSYSTAINVHNPYNQTVYLYKKVVIAKREDEPRGQISAFRKVVLKPDEAIEIDCIDIGSLITPQPVPIRPPEEPEPSIIPLPPQEGEVQCPTGCYCMTPKAADGKGLTAMCQKEPCDTDASGELMYCFKQPTEEPEPSIIPPGEVDVQCPTGCECMTETQARVDNLVLCQGQQTLCGYAQDTATTATHATSTPMYCYEKPTVQTTPPPTYEYSDCPEGCFCMDPDEAGKKNLEWCLRNGDEIPCGTDTAGIQRYCFQEPAAQPTGACPQGCFCMTETDADTSGYSYCEGVRRHCGYDEYQNDMFCFQKPSGTSGLTDVVMAMPEETGLSTPPGQQNGNVQQVHTITPVRSLVEFAKGFVVIYASAPLDVVAVYTASTPVGFSLDVEYLSPTSVAVRPIPPVDLEEPEEPPPTEAECPRGCDCVPEWDIAEYDLALCDGRKIVCGPNHLCAQDKEEAECPQGCDCVVEWEIEEYNLALCDGREIVCGPNHLCAEEKEEAECPQGCFCATQREAKELGLPYCRGEEIFCGLDQYQNEMFCFEEPPPTTTECPYGCFCMFPQEAGNREWCLRNGDEIPCGEGRYCFREPEEPTPTETQCPRGCYCVTEEEGYGRGYERCQGTDMPCAWDTAQNPVKFCFQPPEEATPTETQCPRGCYCVTEEEGYGRGYERCQGTEMPCAWDAAQNPTKVCFQPPEEPRYETCPGTCTCMTYARAEAGGYELCEQRKIQCGADEYCFFKPLKTYVVPIQKCPQGCACMTPEQAEERGYREWCLRDGDEIPCGEGRYCFSEPTLK